MDLTADRLLDELAPVLISENFFYPFIILPLQLLLKLPPYFSPI
jgi:hypothetical protein